VTELCTPDIPSTLFTPSVDNSLRWLVCHTKPRCEKKFANLLDAAGINHYLPLYENVRKYDCGTTKRTQNPLFPSYVFAQVPIELKTRLYEQQLIVRTLIVENEHVFLRQLVQVQKVIASGFNAMIHPRLTKGIKVRIKSGPLWGVEGRVADPSNIENIVLEVDVLQQGLLIKVPIDQIEILN
jgi:transcription antitermination factor NusG